jgi:cytochrome d ubiquinol oxidase subunit II
MLILFTFVVQAVSYEFQHKRGNLVGARPFQWCLILNGIFGPLLIGGAVATFFEGSNFVVSKMNLTDGMQPVISSWANASHGLDALLCPWVLVLGFAVVFLTRILGLLYFMNNVEDENIRSRISVRLVGQTIPFLILFVAYVVHLMLKDGYAYDPASGIISIVPMKYFHNLVELWPLAILLVIGVILVLYGIIRTIISKTYIKGIWPVGIGTVITVLVLLLLAGWNNTAYYPSTADLQSSLTIQNSSSSEFTLRTMFYVSLLIPFVLGYIVYAWRAMDKKKITPEEVQQDDHLY